MDPLPSSLRQQHLAQLKGADADAVNAQSFPATWRVGGIPPAVLGSNAHLFPSLSPSCSLLVITLAVEEQQLSRAAWHVTLRLCSHRAAPIFISRL